jgi:hypothetical protein
MSTANLDKPYRKLVALAQQIPHIRFGNKTLEAVHRVFGEVQKEMVEYLLFIPLLAGTNSPSSDDITHTN